MCFRETPFTALQQGDINDLLRVSVPVQINRVIIISAKERERSSAMMYPTLGRAPKERRCSVCSTNQQFSNLREAETKVPIAMMCQTVARERSTDPALVLQTSFLTSGRGREQNEILLCIRRCVVHAVSTDPSLVCQTCFSQVREEESIVQTAVMDPTVCRAHARSTDPSLVFQPCCSEVREGKRTVQTAMIDVPDALSRTQVAPILSLFLKPAFLQLGRA